MYKRQDHASLKVKQEMLEFDEFIYNLKGDNKKHVGALMSRLAQLEDILDKKMSNRKRGLS